MSSTKKTSSLGLNLWEETDKPERLDFVRDNEKLEELVGEHLKSTTLHLTTDEKSLLKTRYQIKSYFGDGLSSVVSTLQFEPKIVIVFATQRPDNTVENGLQNVFRAIWCSGYSTPGISVSGTKVTLKYQTEAEALQSGTGYRLRLNENKYAYGLLAIR